MNKTNFNALDLNLLSVFVLLMQERSVTGAADRLSLGQPAVSHALARLRSLIGDPLFVRAGRLMEPTPRAFELFETVGPALDSLEAAVRAQQPFDPDRQARTFRLALSDDLQMAYLPQIVRRLTREMPLAKLIVVPSDYRQAAATLERKQASVVVGYLDKLPAAAKIRKIKRTGYRVLQAEGAARHTGANPRLQAYCQRLHVLVTFAGDLVGYVDETLHKRGLQRTVHLSVPAFAILPFVLRQTDYLATVPDHVAAALGRTHGLASGNLPFASPGFDISMAWAAATDRDPAEQHLRRILLQELQSEPVPL